MKVNVNRLAKLGEAPNGRVESPQLRLGEYSEGERRVF